MVCPEKGEAWQGDAQSETPKGTARERGKQREIRQTLKPMREIWLNIELEKVNMHKGVVVKALLDNRAMGLFMNKKLAEREEFKLDKLKKLLRVRNVDGSDNSGGAIIHKIEANVYYKGHVKRV